MRDIFDYFTEIQRVVGELSEVEVERYEEQVLTKGRGNLRIRLRFMDNSLLEISESILITDNLPQWISSVIIIKIQLESLYFVMTTLPIIRKSRRTHATSIFPAEYWIPRIPALKRF